MLCSHTKWKRWWLASFCQSHYMFHAVINAWQLEPFDRGGDVGQRDEERWKAKGCNVIKPEGVGMPLLKESWIIMRQFLQGVTDTSGHLVSCSRVLNSYQTTIILSLPSHHHHGVIDAYSARTEAQWLYSFAMVVGDDFILLAIYSANDFNGHNVLAVHEQWWLMSLTSQTGHGQLPTYVRGYMKLIVLGKSTHI